MIPVLFHSTTTDFSNYGIGVLSDCISCEVTEERNGAFECTIKYPVTGNLFSEIQQERIVKAKPNDTSDNQAFRIYRITMPLNGIVTVYCQHISYDLSNIAVLQWSDSSISPSLAMNRVLQNTASAHPFICQTDFSSTKPFTVPRPQSVRACLGGTEGSFLDTWGGEFEWDNFRIFLHSHRGRDTGVVIEYGKNLIDLEHDTDSTSVYTDLLPYAVSADENGTETVITLTETLLPITNTELLQQKTLIKDFSDSFGTQEAITEESLRRKANEYIENNPLGTLAPTLTVSFEPLWKQPEYAAVLERVCLCDTVKVRHTDLRITVKAKVIATVYDALAEKYVSITLGTDKANLLSDIGEVEKKAEKANEKADRFPMLMNTAISNATKRITGQTGGYVLLNTNNETGQPYELLIMDTASVDSAVHVWRWNVNGLGYSHTGYNGPYETAITSDGQIVADFITSGTLIANIIRAGVLQSRDGSSWWDLETGEVMLRAYATTSSVTQTNERIDEINAQKMYRLVITSSNGNIFKNNSIQTTLSATVFSWDENITDTLDENQFVWTRVSQDNEADEVWNADHYGGTKTISITSADVSVRATFFCDLIDTTTRDSLLG